MIVKPYTGVFVGQIQVPGDKSVSHRSIMLGALANGQTRIKNFLMGEDCLSTIDCFRKLGVTIEVTSEEVIVYGVGLAGLKKPHTVLDAGNSGTTIRIMSGVLACQNFQSTIDGDDSLKKRPMSRVADPLNKMGAQIVCTNEKYPPIHIYPSSKIKGLKYIQPTASAQVKSCLLMAGMYSEEGVEVIQPSISRDHTERMMRHFGIPVYQEDKMVRVNKTKAFEGKEVYVPGDISTAAFYMVMAAIVPGSNICIKNVGVNPTRTGIIDVLKQMGADIVLENESVINEEPIADIRVRGSRLKGIEIAGDVIPRIIDEIPIISLAAVFSEGTTSISDAEELRVKETDRIEAVCCELRKMQANIIDKPDGMIIHGTSKLTGAKVKSYGDHRMAMMLSLAGMLASNETAIDDVACANVSNPIFFDLIKELME